MRPSRICGVVIAAGLLLGGVGWAAESATGHRAHPGNSPIGRFFTGQAGRMLTLKSEMNLTDAQRQQIRSVLESHRSEIAAAAKELVTRHRVVQTQVLADKPDEQAIRSATTELGKAIGDAAVLAARIRGELAPILTDPQKKLLESFRIDTMEAVDHWLSEMAQPHQAAQ